MGAIGAGSAVALGGCITDGGDSGGGNEEAPETDVEESEMADEINIWGFSQLPPAYESLAESYNEQTDADVTVEVEELGFDENINQFQSAISSGQGGPSVGTVENRNTPSYVGQNGLTDFGGAISDETVDNMVDWTWATLADDSGEGRHGLPLDIAPVMTFYNRDLYDQMGVSPDDIETYDDLIDAGQELGEDEYVAAVSTNTMSWRWEMLLRQQGGQPYTEDGALNLDTEECVQAAQVIQDLFEAGVVVDLEEFSESWVTAVSEGRIATLTTGAWMVGALEGVFPDMSGNWGMHRPPAVTEGGGRATNHGGSNLVIPSQKEQEEVNRAFDFINWALTNEGPLMTLAEEAGIYVANTKVHDNDFWSEGKEYFDGQSLELIFDIAPDIPTMRMVSDHTDVYERMGDWFSQVANGELSPEEMASEAEADLADRTGRDTA